MIDCRQQFHAQKTQLTFGLSVCSTNGTADTQPELHRDGTVRVNNYSELKETAHRTVQRTREFQDI